MSHAFEQIINLLDPSVDERRLDLVLIVRDREAETIVNGTDAHQDQTCPAIFDQGDTEVVFFNLVVARIR